MKFVLPVSSRCLIVKTTYLMIASIRKYGKSFFITLKSVRYVQAVGATTYQQPTNNLYITITQPTIYPLFRVLRLCMVSVTRSNDVKNTGLQSLQISNFFFVKVPSPSGTTAPQYSQVFTLLFILNLVFFGLSKPFRCLGLFITPFNTLFFLLLIIITPSNQNRDTDHSFGIYHNSFLPATVLHRTS